MANSVPQNVGRQNVSRRNVQRWLTAAAVPAAVVLAAVAVPLTADASPNLPEKSADDVLAMIADSRDVAFSGDLEQTSDLGLPALPSGVGGSSTGLSTAVELLGGDHAARVFVDGAGSSRVQVLDRLDERDVIVNGSEAWLYDSSSREATHVTVADDLKARLSEEAAERAARRDAAADGLPKTPAEFADRLLEAVEPTTDISVSDTARVAGRAVYELSLVPSTGDTLVESVVLSVDAETGLPLSFAVSAVGGSEPAFSVAFTSVDFSAPDAALFDFTPPTGATVIEKPITADDLVAAEAKGDRAEASAEPGASPSAAPTVIGEGWGAIVALPVDTLTSDDAAVEAPGSPAAPESDVSASELLDQLTTPVAGGRVLQTALISVLITDDGRILVGAVDADRLAVAAG
ncbi:MAG: hypothetical protein RI885_2376 [Actinomycetota bacterium]